MDYTHSYLNEKLEVNDSFKTFNDLTHWNYGFE